RARGAYIQFLDADDVIAPDKIAVQLAALQELGPRWVAASLWGRFRGDVRDTQWQPPWPTPRQRGIDWLVHAWADGDMMAPHGWLVPRPVADAAGPWNPKAGINDDGEYFARVLLAAEGIAQVPAARVHYRSGNASYSQRKDRWAWESLLDSYELCARHLLAAEDSPRVRRAIVARLETFEYLAYPGFPDLVARAEAISEALGLPPRRPHGGGRASRIAGRILGWKVARRLGILARG
ncbi:MAG TPA: glycosyltransferase, partial [Usitatibacter sp.]|nr:glycosyltransferase [Usitatibacter sp.]